LRVVETDDVMVLCVKLRGSLKLCQPAVHFSVVVVAEAMTADRRTVTSRNLAVGHSASICFMNVSPKTVKSG
jgi:hypothetical protein